MSMPSPFELGRAVGGNVSGAIRGNQENSALDTILQEAMQSEDPNVHNDVMRQILTRVSPEKRPAALQILQNKTQQMQQQRQKSALQQEGYNPDLPEYVNKEVAKTKTKEKQNNEQGQEQIQNAFERAQEILGTGYTGFSYGVATPEGRKQRAELDTLSEVFISHLIPLLNPRGTISQARFEYIKGLVPKSSDSNAKIKGKLAALRQIFQQGGEKEGKESKSDFIQMRSPDGVIRNIPKDQVQAASQAGGVLVQ